MKILSFIVVIILQLQICDSIDESKPISHRVKIEFRLAVDSAVEGFDVRELDSQKIYLNPKVEITEKDILLATKSLNDYGNYIIMIEMSEVGAKKFGVLTENNIKKKVAIIVNGKILMAPVINEKIPDGKIQISGNFNKQEIEDLFTTLTRE